MRLGRSSSKATVSPGELFVRPASTIEVNRRPDYALSRVAMRPPAPAVPQLERAAEKALFRLENDDQAHRELGWTHACRKHRAIFALWTDVYRKRGFQIAFEKSELLLWCKDSAFFELN